MTETLKEPHAGLNVRLSPAAWSVFDQLRDRHAVEDGDIINKAGRDELIRDGYAVRTAANGLAVTNLTEKGCVVMAHLSREWGRA